MRLQFENGEEGVFFASVGPGGAAEPRLVAIPAVTALHTDDIDEAEDG